MVSKIFEVKLNLQKINQEAEALYKTFKNNF